VNLWWLSGRCCRSRRVVHVYRGNYCAESGSLTTGAIHPTCNQCGVSYSFCQILSNVELGEEVNQWLHSTEKVSSGISLRSKPDLCQNKLIGFVRQRYFDSRTRACMYSPGVVTFRYVLPSKCFAFHVTKSEQSYSSAMSIICASG